MSLFIFLTVVQGIIAAALVGLVLMQRSEGGGLGIGSGGSPGGLMSARGAADFLTRTTKWLAVLFVVLAIVLAALAGLVLMQRSEGGGLGIGSGGSPGGLMSARGAADFLTRTTKWLAVLFVVLAIVLAALAVGATTGREIDESAAGTAAPAQPDPLAPVAPLSGGGLDAPVIDAPAPAETAPAADDPLAGVAE